MKKALSLALLSIFALTASMILLSHRSSGFQDREAISAPASVQHWAGTDDLGRDRAARLASAFLLGLVGAACASAITAAISILVGVGTAFARPRVSRFLLYGSDVFLGLPWLFLLMLVRSMLPLNLPSHLSAAVTVALLASLGWPIYVRSLYARATSLRRADWLLQARANGLSAWRIGTSQVLPHVRPLYLTQFLLGIPAFIIAEANLGSLGLGVSEPLVSWGSLLQELGSSAQLGTTHWVYLPLALLVAILLCIELCIPED